MDIYPMMIKHMITDILHHKNNMTVSSNIVKPNITIIVIIIVLVILISYALYELIEYMRNVEMCKQIARIDPIYGGVITPGDIKNLKSMIKRFGVLFTKFQSEEFRSTILSEIMAQAMAGSPRNIFIVLCQDPDIKAVLKGLLNVTSMATKLLMKQLKKTSLVLKLIPTTVLAKVLSVTPPAAAVIQPIVRVIGMKNFIMLVNKGKVIARNVIDWMYDEYRFVQKVANSEPAMQLPPKPHVDELFDLSDFGDIDDEAPM